MTAANEPGRSDNELSPGHPRSRTPTGQAVRFLVIGRILGPVGVEGDLRAQVLTDFPDRFLSLQSVHVGDSLRPYRVQSVRLENGTVLLKLAGLDSADAVRPLAKQDLSISISEAAPLAPDQYFWHEIVGLDVWTDTGQHLGKVRQVLATGSNDVYIVGEGAQEILLPAIEDVIKSIDLDEGTMTVHLIPGLAEEIP